MTAIFLYCIQYFRINPIKENCKHLCSHACISVLWSSPWTNHSCKVCESADSSAPTDCFTSQFIDCSVLSLHSRLTIYFGIIFFQSIDRVNKDVENSKTKQNDEKLHPRTLHAHAHACTRASNKTTPSYTALLPLPV